MYKHIKTGLAFIVDGSTGNIHTCHPSIDATGSLRGMRKHYKTWQNAQVIRCLGSIYNIDIYTCRDELDEYAGFYCTCGGKHERKNQCHTI